MGKTWKKRERLGQNYRVRERERGRKPERGVERELFVRRKPLRWHLIAWSVDAQQPQTISSHQPLEVPFDNIITRNNSGVANSTACNLLIENFATEPKEEGSKFSNQEP